MLGVPFADPLPVPLSERLLRRLGITAEIVQPARRTRARAARSPARRERKAPRAEVNIHVLALHAHY